jgi:hypothetical protein
VCRRLAAPGVRAVHHVVVDQRARLHQFQRRHGGDHVGAMGTVGAAGTAVAPVRERRPQPLAAAEQQDAGRLEHGRQRRRVDRGEPLALPGEERGERGMDAAAQVGPVEHGPGRRDRGRRGHDGRR